MSRVIELGPEDSEGASLEDFLGEEHSRQGKEPVKRPWGEHGMFGGTSRKSVWLQHNPLSQLASISPSFTPLPPISYSGHTFTSWKYPGLDDNSCAHPPTTSGVGGAGGDTGKEGVQNPWLPWNQLRRNCSNWGRDNGHLTIAVGVESMRSGQILYIFWWLIIVTSATIYHVWHLVIMCLT